LWKKITLKMPAGARHVVVPTAKKLLFNTSSSAYIYHSRFIPKGVAATSQIFHRHAHVLPKQLSPEEY
jgi:hypothetical protein